MSEGFFAHAKSILADEDRTEFDFNKDFSNDELLVLVERNPRVFMQCFWMAEQMFKEGIEHPQLEKLEDISFIAKCERGIGFARLHGESIAVCLNDNPDLSQNSEKFWDFEIYHRLSNNNGWSIEEVYPKGHKDAGQPSKFKISIQTEKMGDRSEYIVPAERCIIFKNPKIGERWGGTPSSKRIIHMAHLEELILRLAGVFALLRCESYQHAMNVPNSEAATALETAMDKIPLKVLSTAPGIMVEPKGFNGPGTMEDFTKLLSELKKYMANAMMVSQSIMDGASEGAGGSNTLSSSTTNTAVSYSTIKAMQVHWKPILEKLLEKIGFQKNFTFKEPNPLSENNGKNTNENFNKGKNVDVGTNGNGGKSTSAGGQQPRK